MKMWHLDFFLCYIHITVCGLVWRHWIKSKTHRSFVFPQKDFFFFFYRPKENFIQFNSEYSKSSTFWEMSSFALFSKVR